MRTINSVSEHICHISSIASWDTVYQEELANFEEIGDEGEIWFGTETVEKMVEWSLQNIPPSYNASVLEIGSGNGTLLFGLLDAGYDPKKLSGIDYSPGAVALSTQIAQTRGGLLISFNECDFLKDDPPIPEDSRLASRMDVWDLILDKGTYDAIGLGPKDDQGRPPSINYPGRATRLLKPGGYFLITSCNYTEDELKSNFATAETGFTYHSRIQHPTYTFGGKSGSMWSSVAFKKPTSH